MLTWLGNATYGVGYEPDSVALGDVNNDGSLDMVMANNGDNNVSVLLNIFTP
jgi:hypothetical protein